MKRKHHGLLSIAMMLIALSATSIYAVNQALRVKQVRIQPVGTPLSSVFVPGQEQIKKMNRLGLKMANFRFPHKTDQTSVNLALFGHFPADASDRTAARSAIAGIDTTPFTLSFTFTSGKRQFCIIDGSFYQIGAVLPDSSRVARIESRRVLIKRDEHKRWIHLTGSHLPNE